MRGTLDRLPVLLTSNDLTARGDPQAVRWLVRVAEASTLGKLWVPLSAGLKVRATPARESTLTYRMHWTRSERAEGCPAAGTTELACGSQAFIATLLFDPSMSALPITQSQKSANVGLFTH